MHVNVMYLADDVSVIIFMSLSISADRPRSCVRNADKLKDTDAHGENELDHLEQM